MKKNSLNWKIIYSAVSILATILILFFIYKKIYGSISDIDFHVLNIKWAYIFISFIFVPVWFFLLSYAYKVLLKNMDAEISVIDAMRIIGISTFGRYIPGKVWFTVGRTLLAEKLGISKRKAFTAVIIETIYQIFTGMLFIIILAVKQYDLPNITYFSFVLAFILLSVFNPQLFADILNFFLKKMNKEILTIKMNLLNRAYIMLVYTAMWVFFGLQFMFLAEAITPISDIVRTTAVYPVSWVFGFIVIFLPSGLGVREGAIIYFMSQILNAPTAIIISALSRVQMTLSEILFLFTLIGSKKLWRNDVEKKS